MENLLKSFIQSERDVLEIPMTPLLEVEKAFNAAGYKKAEVDINAYGGFSAVFYNKVDDEFVLSGNLWSGNYKITRETY